MRNELEWQNRICRGAVVSLFFLLFLFFLCVSVSSPHGKQMWACVCVCCCIKCNCNERSNIEKSVQWTRGRGEEEANISNTFNDSRHCTRRGERERKKGKLLMHRWCWCTKASSITACTSSSLIVHGYVWGSLSPSFYRRHSQLPTSAVFLSHFTWHRKYWCTFNHREREAAQITHLRNMSVFNFTLRWLIRVCISLLHQLVEATSRPLLHFILSPSLSLSLITLHTSCTVRETVPQTHAQAEAR